MKSIVYVTIILAIIAGAFAANAHINQVLDDLAEAGQPQKEIFQAFHFLHNKQYELNSQEGLRRYRIFKQNVQWQKGENAKLGKEIYGITQFTDMTHEEFVENTLMKPEIMQKNIDELNEKSLRFLSEEQVIRHEHHHVHEHFHHYNQEEKTNKNEELSETNIDHRKYDGVAKSQGGCGSCWAFAAIAAIENQYHALTGNMTLFSEQYLVDCDNMDYGCQGGWPTNTFNWIKDNGIIRSEALPYAGMAGECDSAKKVYEYKVVTGATAFDAKSPLEFNNNWDKMLAQGPMVVAMDASFEGFGSYRPKEFDAIEPKSCGKINHAVTAVGAITENGKQYLIVRNSWGQYWGYKGYFKITRSINCSITSWGWLPKIDKNGKVPDVHPPKPKPKPLTDCVKLYGWEGFSSKPILEPCDSVPELENYFFYGAMFPKETKSGNAIKLMAFPWQSCGGKWQQPIEQSIEFVQRDGKQAFMASLAFVKQAKPNCINFYTDVCHKGDPAFSICDNIRDTQLVNFSQLNQVKSILADNLSIKRISFFTEANYEGKAVEISGDAVYNVSANWRLGYYFKNGYIRSVRIHTN